MKEKNENEQSEEIQDIIERMPTNGAIYVAVFTAILAGAVFVLGFIIKYPDTIEGRISITAKYAPVRLVSNANGKIHLLKKNKEVILEKEIIAYIESGANVTHVLLVDSLLREYIFEETICETLADLELGELSSVFGSFLVAIQQYRQTIRSEVYHTMQTSLTRQIQIDKNLLVEVEKNKIIKKQLLSIESEQMQKDSILANIKVISEQDFKKQQSKFLSIKEAYEGLHTDSLSKLAQMQKKQLELQQIKLEEEEKRSKMWIELIARKNELSNSIRLWKEKYLLYSPIHGELEFLGFWRENEFIQTGQELFSVIPTENEIMGEVLIPAYGVGKVKVGQIANVKIENYPYDEYGMIKGNVLSISRLANDLKKGNGESEKTYRIIISFPAGICTNYGNVLNLDFESFGTVEIVTKRKKLIDRLFDNLKAKREN